VIPQEFSGVADLLVGLPQALEEGRKRTAISRYYYAAFLESRDRLKDARGWVFKKREAHEKVRRAFEWADPNEKQLRLAGRLLKHLKDLREDADYDIDVALDTTSLGEAKKMCAEIQGVVATADLTKCRDPNNL